MQLSDDNLFLDSLPRDWLPLLELLRELDLLNAQRKAEPVEDLRAGAGLLRSQILQHTRILTEETPQKLQVSSPEFRRWFTEAVLLWPLFAETGGTVLANTTGTTVLADYPVDFRPTEGEREILRSALQRMYGWTRLELDEIESNLRRLTSNLLVKKAIGHSLSALLDDNNAADLMRRVYGPIPWRSGDVDIVITTSAVFFCLPFDGAALTSADFGERPESERESITAFLERVCGEQQTLKGIRFPAFGFFDAALLDTHLIAHLNKAVSNGADVAKIFSTMVTILPTHEVEKYLVHDAWGHGWQEALCEFEVLYRDISSLNGNSTVTTEADLRRRISVGINLIVSEFLADLVEFKFLKHCGPLPSSSLFVDSPLCLDLSLDDTRRMVRAWRNGSSGLFAAVLGDSTDVTQTASGVRVNLLQKILLSVFALDAALDRFLADGEAHYRELCAERPVPRWHCPLACTDLLVLLLGWFYEQHRAVNVWGLDELVTGELRPALLQLEQAIRGELA